jgi:uncharacterized membrane protein YesL
MLRSFGWAVYDHLGGVVALNLLWSVCALPWLLTGILLVGLGIDLQGAWGDQAAFVFLVIAVEWVLLSPPTLLLFWATSQWVRDKEYSFQKLVAAGRKLFWRGQLTALVLIGITLVLLANFFFYQYWGGFIGLVLSGAMLWLLVGLAFTMVHIFPVTVTQQLSVWRTVQQSSLLALDNFKLSCILVLGVGVGLGLAALMVVPLFVGALTSVALWLSLGFRYIAAKYNSEQITPQMPRSWRQVLRPWEN